MTHTVTGVRHLRQEALPLTLIAAALAAAVLLCAGNTFVLSILATTFLFAGLATAWNVIGGFGGQFSLCHAVFFAEGAYLTGNLVLHGGVSPWLSLPPSFVLAAVTGTLISWPVFRLRGPFFAIATMTFNEVVFVLANVAEPVTGGAQGLRVPYLMGWRTMIFPGRIAYAWLMLGFLLLCLASGLWLLRSRLGYTLQAVRDNEAAAEACGIPVLRTKLLAMAISAGLTGIGGSLFMMYVRIVDPPTLLSLSDVGVRIALVAVIGGLGTGYGPLLGALLVVPLDAWLRANLGAAVPGANLVVMGAALVLASLFFKRGLAGALVPLRLRLAGRGTPAPAHPS